MAIAIETRSDCTRCAALCCIAFPSETMEGFAASKERGEACPRLRPDGSCSIYDRRKEEGFAGCVGFECFGAGQYVTQLHGGNSEWRADPELLARMVDSFLDIRRAFELLWLAGHAKQSASTDNAHGTAHAIEESLREIIEHRDQGGELRDLAAVENDLRDLLVRERRDRQD